MNRVVPGSPLRFEASVYNGMADLVGKPVRKPESPRNPNPDPKVLWSNDLWVPHVICTPTHVHVSLFFDSRPREDPLNKPADNQTLAAVMGMGQNDPPAADWENFYESIPASNEVRVFYAQRVRRDGEYFMRVTTAPYVGLLADDKQVCLAPLFVIRAIPPEPGGDNPNCSYRIRRFVNMDIGWRDHSVYLLDWLGGEGPILDSTPTGSTDAWRLNRWVEA